MKFALVLLVLLPCAFSASIEKRNAILDFLGLPHLADIFDIHEIKQTVQAILDQLGSEHTEKQCENKCHQLLQVEEGHLLHTACTPLCRSFQTVVSMLHIVPKTTPAPV